jgi:hypothetical protein
MLLNQHMTPKRLRITSGIGVHKKTSLIDSVAKTGLDTVSLVVGHSVQGSLKERYFLSSFCIDSSSFSR